MPHYDEIGEFGLGQLLAKRLTTPGGAVAPTVAPELFPGLTLENDRPEWGFLKGEQHGSVARRIVAGGAGEFGLLWLSNPFAPNLLIVERIEAFTTATIVIGTGVYPGFTVGSTIGNGINRDERYQQNNQAVFEAGTTAVPPTVARTAARLAQGTVFTSPIILAPTNTRGLIVLAATSNVEITVNVHYRLRGAQPGELV